MFSNGRKTIGLFIVETREDFQQHICHGIAERAEQLGYNVAVFTNYVYGNYESREKFSRGEMEIFDLPPYEDLAGVVLAYDTFILSESKEYIMERLRERTNCPIVSLREEVVGANNILLDERTTMEGIIRHVINEHGAKDIAFMTGIKGRYDAEARLCCFKNLMKEYGYPIGENRIFYGDFWRNTGKEACDLFLADGKYPDAIICANDNMAFSIIDELHGRGIHVPEDIIVTGYDGMEDGLTYSPTLTTVKVDFEDMAYQAVDIIHRHQENDMVETLFAKTKVTERESCGCKKLERKAIAQRSAGHRREVYQENLEIQISFMSMDFGTVLDIEKMHEVIFKYIFELGDLRDYYICLRDDIEGDKQVLQGFTNTMNLRCGIKDKKDMEEINIAFSRKDLLPASVIGPEPQCFYFAPIHYQDQCFGYEAYRYVDNNQGGNLYVRWSITLANAVQNILVQKKMNNLIQELENMYIQDVLTGLYNRRGFEKYARMQFSKARATESTICVLAIDMDGLKPINDIYGHHEGDSALRSVGYAIQEARHPGQIGARIGGDEFEVTFPCQGEEDVERWIQKFQRSLAKFNEKSGKPYDVYASLGYKVGVPGAGDTIESYMKESDDIMYKNKVANKVQRNDVGN